MQVPFAQPLSPGSGNRSFELPGWGEGELVAAVTATASNKNNSNRQSSHLDLLLREGSLEVVTSEVSDDGRLNMSNVSDSDEGEQWIFAFYQRRTLAKNLIFPASSSDTIFDNGSFTVDHFSERGAQTVIDFWETHILPDGIDDLLSEVGNYGEISQSDPPPYSFRGIEEFPDILAQRGRTALRSSPTYPGLQSFRSVSDSSTATTSTLACLS